MEIYLDNAATTVIHDEVVDFMRAYLEEEYGNPNSAHRFGVEARKAVNKAREQVAQTIGAEPDEVYFTSSGTEANNWALKCLPANGAVNRVAISAIEHSSVRNTAKALGEGMHEIIPVDEYGMVTPDALKKVLGENNDIQLVSIHHANNEIGTLQPIAELAEIAHDHDALFHTDAVQTYGKIRFDVFDLGVDMLSMSAHKVHGPMGVGALYVRSGVELKSFIHGGGHENGMRAGTLNVSGIVGFGLASEMAWSYMDDEAIRQTALIEDMWARISETVKGSKRNGHPTERIPNILSVTLPNVDCYNLTAEMGNRYNIFMGCGSACSTDGSGSKVIRALGGSVAESRSTIRMSISKYNDKRQCSRAAGFLHAAINQCKKQEYF
jgi:cysteine desulfurase